MHLSDHYPIVAPGAQLGSSWGEEEESEQGWMAAPPARWGT